MFYYHGKLFQRTHDTNTTIKFQRYWCSFGTATSSGFRPQFCFGVGHWVPGPGHSFDPDLNGRRTTWPRWEHGSGWVRGHMTAEAPPLGAGASSRWYLLPRPQATDSGSPEASRTASASLIPAFRWHVIGPLAGPGRFPKATTGAGMGESRQ